MNSLIISFVLGLGFQSADKLPNDSLNENKHVISDYFFKKNLSIRNAGLKFRYLFQKQNPRISPLLSDTNQWVLSFCDEFDSLNTNKWRLGQAWGEFHPDHPHQYYSKELIQVQAGYLHLKGQYQPKVFPSGDSSITIPFGIGLINSDISFQQKYGYFEIRSKNPKGAATWPAFWLTGATRWPPEIDIFEMYGRKTGSFIHHQFATIHYGQSGTKSRGYLSKRINLPKNTDTLFHTYACEWSPKQIKFYTDGRLVAFIRVNENLRRWMDEPMVLIINNAFDETYLKYLGNRLNINSDFIVDWVRVYKKRENP